MRKVNLLHKTILFLSCYFFNLLNLSGQAPASPFSNISIASPNAAALAKYVDFPVNYNTGLPQINIPIYTVKSGALELPISLSYHAGGLKVQELASWVGAGWSLNAGGMITRSVRGAPDDKGYLTKTQFGHYSDYGYNSYYVAEKGPPPITTGCNTYYDSGKYIRVADLEIGKGYRDGEPDLFFFNFGNYSGKFYFNDDRTPMLVPEADFKIQTYTQPGLFAFIGFIITTPDGIQYHFGNTIDPVNQPNSIERSNIMNVQNGLNSENINTAWYLTKIITQDAQFSIDLLYDPDKYSVYNISMFPILPKVQPSDPGPLPNDHYELIKNFIDGSRLKQIRFSNGSIDFIPEKLREDLSDFQFKSLFDAPNTESKALGNIIIKNNNGFIKKYQFFQSYFSDSTTPLVGQLTSWTGIKSDTKRLRLDSLLETTVNASAQTPPYIFEYSSNFAPRILSLGIDHWGFYNGKLNATLIPTYTINDFEQVVPGADRDSYWPEMKMGSLEKIIYPTGGFTQFVWEPHTIWANYTYPTSKAIYGFALGSPIGNTRSQTFSIQTKAENLYKFSLTYSIRYEGDILSNLSKSSISVLGIGSVSKDDPKKDVILQLGTGTKTYTMSCSGSSPNDMGELTIYELSTNTSQANKIVGGLRIKQIVHKDPLTNQNLINDFSYNNGQQSSGVLYSRPVYVQGFRNDILQKIGGWAEIVQQPNLPLAYKNGCLFLEGGIIKSPVSVPPLATIQGNHIGYNRVELSQAGKGKSVYQYYGSDVWEQNQNDVCVRNLVMINNVCSASDPNYPAAPLPFDFFRGELKTETHYDAGGNMLKLKFYYPEFKTNQLTTPATISRSNQVTRYDLSTAKKIKMTTIERSFLPNGTEQTKTDSVFFESPYHTQVTRLVSINSKGEKDERIVKYTADFRTKEMDNLAACLNVYNVDYGQVLSKFNYDLQNCQSTTCNCKWTAFQKYRYYFMLARQKYISCSRINYTDPNSKYKQIFAAAKLNADATLKPILALQESYENPPIETSSWKNGKLLSAEFNIFDFDNSPAGKVYPKKQQKLYPSTLSTQFTGSTVAATGTSLNKDSRYTEEAIYNFNSGNLSEFTAKNGVTTAYLWGYNNTYPVAKIVGSSYSTAAALVDLNRLNNPATTDAAMRTELQKLRAGLTNSMVATYTYAPMLGMTSETDPMGRTKYYTYDGLGRLILIKDEDGNILKKICYNYAGQPDNCVPVYYKNAALSAAFTRNNCSLGYQAGSVSYSVPAGKYQSIFSQTDADSQAQADMNANGQNYANTNAVCNLIYYNTAKNGSFTRTNCAAGYQAGAATYTVAANKYQSIISQTDADAKAQADMNANGQNYANANAVCNLIYYNTAKSVSFTRNNCAAGYQASSVSYSVAANKYQSIISQTDADAKAQADINVNGQNYANANAICIPPPNWVSISSPSCEKSSSGCITGNLQHQEKDMQVGSLSNNQTRWVNDGQSLSTCPLPSPDWQSATETEIMQRIGQSKSTYCSNGLLYELKINRALCSPGYNSITGISRGYSAQCGTDPTPKWTVTNTKCLQNNGANTGIQEVTKTDTNPYSPTYNQTQVSTLTNVATCPAPPNWVGISSRSCEKSSSGCLTGNLQHQEKDMQVNSSTYNQTRWVSDGQSLSTCPLPSPDWQSATETEIMQRIGQSKSTYCSNGLLYELKINRALCSPGYNSITGISRGYSAQCGTDPTPKWTVTNTKCLQNNGVNTGSQEVTKTDTNPYSPTYNQTQVPTTTNTTACPLPPNWVSISSPGCEKSSSGCLTGNLQHQEKDMQVGSLSNNQTRWVSDGQNLTACPLPAAEWRNANIFEMSRIGQSIAIYCNNGILYQYRRDTKQCSPSYNSLKSFAVGYSAQCGTDPTPKWTITTTKCLQTNGTNTGIQEVTKTDTNPYSPTYNQKQVSTITNTTACPLPSPPVIIGGSSFNRTRSSGTGKITGITGMRVTVYVSASGAYSSRYSLSVSVSYNGSSLGMAVANSGSRSFTFTMPGPSVDWSASFTGVSSMGSGSFSVSY